MRLSRTSPIIKGSLKGLSAKDYWRLSQFKNRNHITAARQYLPDNLFTKFDRQKPLSQQQISEVKRAVHRGLLDITPDYPITTPVVNWTELPVKGYVNRKVLLIRGYRMLRMTPVPTPEGTIYLVYGETLEDDGVKAEFGLSSHAIERLKERFPTCLEWARDDLSIVPRMFVQAVQEGKVVAGEFGPQLKVGPIGFLPFKMVIADKSYWIGTTFLVEGMRGVANV